MSWKIILAVIVLVAIAVGLAYWFGRSKGRNVGDLACVTAHAGDAAAYQARETKAQALARQAQQQADAEQLQQLQSMLIKAQDAASKAAATAAAAQERSKALNDALTELSHENADVGKWRSHCLPAALLARLHPETNPQAYPAACRAAAGGHPLPVPAHTAQPVAGG
jgi:hypothetical protein